MRKYNYGSIILILIVNAIISGILQNIADGNLSILSGFVAFIFDYIICRDFFIIGKEAFLTILGE